MSVIIHEQDILKKNPPVDKGFWDEESIRQYQEANGINYGGSVFCRGEKPHRVWSNDRNFHGEKYVQPVVENKDSKDAEIEALKATVQGMKELIESLKMSMTPSLEVSPEGAERHGKPIDKRSKAYRDSLK